MTIHLPGDDLGRAPGESGAQPASEPPRGGSRGDRAGCGRRRRPVPGRTAEEEAHSPRLARRAQAEEAAAASGNGAGPEPEADAEDELDVDAEAEIVEAEPVEAEPVEAAAAAVEEPEPLEEPQLEPEPSPNGDPADEWGYVPMSEWADDLDRPR